MFVGRKHPLATPHVALDDVQLWALMREGWRQCPCHNLAGGHEHDERAWLHRANRQRDRSAGVQAPMTDVQFGSLPRQNPRFHLAHQPDCWLTGGNEPPTTDRWRWPLMPLMAAHGRSWPLMAAGRSSCVRH